MREVETLRMPFVSSAQRPMKSFARHSTEVLLLKRFETAFRDRQAYCPRWKRYRTH